MKFLAIHVLVFALFIHSPGVVAQEYSNGFRARTVRKMIDKNKERAAKKAEKKNLSLEEELAYAEKEITKQNLKIQKKVKRLLKKSDRRLKKKIKRLAKRGYKWGLLSVEKRELMEEGANDEKLRAGIEYSISFEQLELRKGKILDKIEAAGSLANYFRGKVESKQQMRAPASGDFWGNLGALLGVILIYGSGGGVIALSVFLNGPLGLIWGIPLGFVVATVATFIMIGVMWDH